MADIDADGVNDLTCDIMDVLGVDDNITFDKIHAILDKFFDYPDYSNYN